MKIFIGLVMGFFSGFLIYVVLAMLVMDPSGTTSTDLSRILFVAVTFLGGWTLSSIVLLHGARSVSKVFSRGFLLGATEWLAMIPAGMIYNGRVVRDSVARGVVRGTGTEAAGARMAVDLISFITGGISILMALVCLLGFAISYFAGKEMKPEAAIPTRRCPECAELIQEAARTCKHCGTEILQSGDGRTKIG